MGLFQTFRRPNQSTLESLEQAVDRRELRYWWDHPLWILLCPRYDPNVFSGVVDRLMPSVAAQFYFGETDRIRALDTDIVLSLARCEDKVEGFAGILLVARAASWLGQEVALDASAHLAELFPAACARSPHLYSCWPVIHRCMSQLFWGNLTQDPQFFFVEASYSQIEASILDHYCRATGYGYRSGEVSEMYPFPDYFKNGPIVPKRFLVP